MRLIRTYIRIMHRGTLADAERWSGLSGFHEHAAAIGGVTKPTDLRYGYARPLLANAPRQQHSRSGHRHPTVTRRINSIQPLIPPQERVVKCAHVLFVKDRVQTCFTAGCAEHRTPLELVDSPSGAQQNNAREAPCHRSLSPKAAAPLP